MGCGVSLTSGKAKWVVGSPWPEAGPTPLPGSHAGDRHPHWVYHAWVQVTQPEGRQQNPGYWPAWPGSFFLAQEETARRPRAKELSFVQRENLLLSPLYAQSHAKCSLKGLNPGASPLEAPSLESILSDTDTPKSSVSGLSQRKEPTAGKAKRREPEEKGSPPGNRGSGDRSWRMYRSPPDQMKKFY